PKVSVLRLNTPRAASNVYVKPADEDPSGNVESWVAMPRLSSVSVACALGCDPKWAAWLKGSGAARRITGLVGAKNRNRSPASPSVSSARAPGATRRRKTRANAERRIIMKDLQRRRRSWSIRGGGKGRV